MSSSPKTHSLIIKTSHNIRFKRRKIIYYDIIIYYLKKIVFYINLFQNEKESKEVNEMKKKVPHIFNLNFDPMLTGNIVHFIDQKRSVGNQRGETSDICLMGPRLVYIS